MYKPFISLMNDLFVWNCRWPILYVHRLLTLIPGKTIEPARCSVLSVRSFIVPCIRPKTVSLVGQQKQLDMVQKQTAINANGGHSTTHTTRLSLIKWLPNCSTPAVRPHDFSVDLTMRYPTFSFYTGYFLVEFMIAKLAWNIFNLVYI